MRPSRTRGVRQHRNWISLPEAAPPLLGCALVNMERPCNPIRRNAVGHHQQGLGPQVHALFAVPRRSSASTCERCSRVSDTGTVGLPPHWRPALAVCLTMTHRCQPHARMESSITSPDHDLEGTVRYKRHGTTTAPAEPLAA